MLDTIKLGQEMGMDWYGIQKLTPLPSTEIYSQMVDEGLIEENSLNLVVSWFSIVKEGHNTRTLSTTPSDSIIWAMPTWPKFFP